jgi:ribonucleoside-diphosphate reductase alpha chain
MRVELPDQRRSTIQKVHINGEKLYLTTGNYPNGKLGEIFVDSCLKKGKGLKEEHNEDPYSSLMRCFAISISIGLQYGVPLEEFVDAFTFTKFKPRGVVQGHDHIKMVTSPIDFIFRHVAIEYLQKYDLAQVHPLKRE